MNHILWMKSRSNSVLFTPIYNFFWYSFDPLLFIIPFTLVTVRYDVIRCNCTSKTIYHADNAVLNIYIFKKISLASECNLWEDFQQERSSFRVYLSGKVNNSANLYIDVCTGKHRPRMAFCKSLWMLGWDFCRTFPLFIQD